MPVPVQDSEGPTDVLSQRQLELDWLWKFYRCTNYEGRKYDWNGREQVGHIEHDVIAHTGQIPPGFYDMGGTMVPIELRTPSTPYYLTKVVVNRFTSLLFSSKRHPSIECDDPKTEDWLTGFAEATRLWSNMIRARTYGGGMGSVGIGFKFVNGTPHVEVHDPRWCTPEFDDKDLLTVGRFDKLYQYPDQVRNADGEWEEQWFWYRRVITDKDDTVWPRVRAYAGEEPNWREERHQTVAHNFGFCPIVWIQNQQVDDSVDGDPDCHGIYELSNRIDVLWSQADRATVANCDPSIVIQSDAEFDELKKGSGNAMQTEKGGSVKYMEMTGVGIEKAMALAEALEERALTVARCMLDRNEGGPSKTATEVDHNYSSMTEQADILREQYGERGVKMLLSMVLQAVRGMQTPKVERGETVSRIVRTVVKLPKKKVIDPKTGALVGWEAREVGQGDQIELNWPQYFTPSKDVVKSAVDAAGKAKEYGLIDQDHAVGYITEYFSVENKAEMIEKIKGEQKDLMGLEDAGVMPKTISGGGKTPGQGLFGGG